MTTRISGEQWSDRPGSVDPVIWAFCQAFNDVLRNGHRRRLKLYFTRIVGTSGSDAMSRRRAWMARDWIAREYTPAWLDNAGLAAEAGVLRALPQITDRVSLKAAIPLLVVAETAATAAGEDVNSAARAAANNATWAAAWAAARSAAQAASGVAASADWATVRAAAWNIARHAAMAAVGDATGKAAKASLQSTVAALQKCAFTLLDWLIVDSDKPWPGKMP